jgi:hypothetical protein
MQPFGSWENESRWSWELKSGRSICSGAADVAGDHIHMSSPRPLRVAIVAPSLRILGGQAVQARRLLDAWAPDPEVEAWLVPINPVPRPPFNWLLDVKYVRTVVTQFLYYPLLLRQLRRADVVHVFSASYASFLLAPLPAVLIAKLYGKPVVLNYRSGEAPDHLRRSAIARRTLKAVDLNVVPSSFLRDVFASFDISSRIVANICEPPAFSIARVIRCDRGSCRLAIWSRFTTWRAPFARLPGPAAVPGCVVDTRWHWIGRAGAPRSGL